MVVAGLLNALTIVGKDLDRIKVALIGMGAANVATYHLLKVVGIDPAGVVACDSKGVLHKERHDIEEAQAHGEKWRACLETNAEGVRGGIAEAMRGADVCLAFSRPGPDTIKPEWVRGMNRGAVVFACANPTPEIWPRNALEAGARIVGTGRSDYPNQVNNSLIFPGVFRGTLDVRARAISDEMAIAAARELARFAADRGIHEGFILPGMDEWEACVHVAVATALKAQEQGIARVCRTREQLHDGAVKIIRQAREATRLLMKEGLIPAASRAG